MITNKIKYYFETSSYDQLTIDDKKDIPQTIWKLYDRNDPRHVHNRNGPQIIQSQNSQNQSMPDHYQITL